MRLTKYTHACVTLETEAGRLLIDPGAFTPERHDLLRRADAVLVTHDHFDHLDIEAVSSALEGRTGLELFGPGSVVDSLERRGVDSGRLHAVAPGQHVAPAGVPVEVHGGSHAIIHEGIQVPENVGYLVAGAVFHPGDSYVVPDASVDTLLVPTSGPWTKVGEAIDFIKAVGPRQTIPVHDVMLSDVGHRSIAMFLGEDGLTGVPLHQLTPSQSIEL